MISQGPGRLCDKFDRISKIAAACSGILLKSGCLCVCWSVCKCVGACFGVLPVSYVELG